MVYTSAADVDFEVAELSSVHPAERVLMATPVYFDVTYAINPHMADHVGQVDRDRAGAEWSTLQDMYRRLGFTVELTEGQPDLPDMVFCANQTLPVHRPNGDLEVVMSRMHSRERRNEVAHFTPFFERRGYRPIHLPDRVNGSFEGMGDALWHPGRYLLWGGYGFRTDIEVYSYLGGELDVPILALELADPDFYHLDTALCLLDDGTALWYPEAFTREGRALLERVFERLIAAPEREARRFLACNAHCPNEQHVLIHDGCEETSERLREHGFTPVRLDLGEFLKAGGSVFCMKQMFW